jgi:alkylation response protein AidB-like acyl-CoA dehydrogenase
MTTEVNSLPETEAPESSRWAAEPVPASKEEWVQRAREVAELVRETAVDRDRDAAAPVLEVQLLKDARLLGIMGPAEHGGGDADWDTTLAVVHQIAQVEGSLTNILGWHYAYFWLFRALGTHEQRQRWEAEVTSKQLLLSGIVNLRDAPLKAVDEGSDIVFNGFKSFNTGVPVCDLVFLCGIVEGSEGFGAFEGSNDFFAIAERRQPGIVLNDDWDTVGQRSTASGTVGVKDVRVPWRDAIGFVGKKFQRRPANLSPGLTSQLLMATFYVGLARGALDQAVAYTRDKSRAWLHSMYERAVDEPHVVDGYGSLQSHLLAAEALVQRATHEVSETLLAPDELTAERRGQLAALVAAAKTVASEVGLEVTTRVFEFTGARATARSFGLDRYWRDLRTQSLHDPIGYKRRQVGANLLTGAAPGPPDWYA